MKCKLFLVQTRKVRLDEQEPPIATYKVLRLTVHEAMRFCVYKSRDFTPTSRIRATSYSAFILTGRRKSLPRDPMLAHMSPSTSSVPLDFPQPATADMDEDQSPRLYVPAPSRFAKFACTKVVPMSTINGLVAVSGRAGFPGPVVAKILERSHRCHSQLANRGGLLVTDCQR